MIPDLWAFQWMEAGVLVETLDYSVLKFAVACGLFEARAPSGWAREFPDCHEGTPVGSRYDGTIIGLVLLSVVMRASADELRPQGPEVTLRGPSAGSTCPSSLEMISQ